jgi:ankyrin repeat protein
MELLLAHGAKVNVRAEVHDAPEGRVWSSPLIEVITERPDEALKKFDLAGAQKAEEDSDARIALLLQHGADPNFSGGLGITPLHSAAEMARLGAVKLLLAHGARVNARDVLGFTALGMRDNCPRYCFSRACSEFRKPMCLPVVQELIAAKAEVNAQGVAGMCSLAPVHIFARHGNVPLLRVLLDAGADPNLGAGRGHAPLHFAISGCGWTVSSGKEDLDTIKLLVERGADVNRVGTDGATPLKLAERSLKHWASEGLRGKLRAENAARIIEFLKASGALE